MLKTRYDTIVPYRTLDGSEIRELMHPLRHGNAHQSLAEATVAPGAETLPHRHRLSEELYHFTAGEGWMSLGAETFPVRAGETVCIPPGELHSLRNPGHLPLRLLCCCAPPYSHEDTELVTS
jgi:mannose-6-phosphate isomerase-like protein (cupin superfamily)